MKRFIIVLVISIPTLAILSVFLPPIAHREGKLLSEEKYLAVIEALMECEETKEKMFYELRQCSEKSP